MSMQNAITLSPEELAESAAETLATSGNHHTASPEDICPGCGNLLANHRCNYVVTTTYHPKTGKVVNNSGSLRRTTDDLCSECGGPLHFNETGWKVKLECMLRQWNEDQKKGLAIGKGLVLTPEMLIDAGQWWLLHPAQGGTGAQNVGKRKQAENAQARANRPATSKAEKRGKAIARDPSVPDMPVPEMAAAPEMVELATAEPAQIAASIPAAAMESAVTAGTDTQQAGEGTVDADAIRAAMKSKRVKRG